MANLNKVFLMGNLTADPEVRGDGDRQVCKLRMAVNRKWKNQAGEAQEEVLFVDVVTFGNQAKNCAEYLRKGRPVMVEGRLKLDEWQDRESGQKRSKIEVVGEFVQFLGSRDDAGGGSGGNSSSNGGQRSSGGGQQSRGSDQGRDAPSGDKGRDEVNFDDIPFAFLITCVGAAAMAALGA